MLRIIPQANSAAAKSYYGRGDYYAADLDAPAVWGGRGAALLGLSGEVRKRDFDRLCDNTDPRSGRPLTARTRSDRTVLYDFNVSVPKSLSVLIEHTGDGRLLAAVQHAADAMMAEAEAEMQTRVRKAGQDADRVTGNMVYAKILHRTSRPSREDGKPDPQTHLHVTVFNATLDPVERRWKAGQFRDLVRDAPYWQAVFHSKLTAELSKLGFGVTRSKAGWEVAGVPKAVVATFSRRTAEIERLAAELGITDPAAKGKLGATSRRGKSDESITDLRQYWDGRMTGPERQALDTAVSDANSGAVVSLASSAAEAARHAVAHCFERASVVPEKRLVAEALTFGVGGVTPEQARAELTQLGVFTRLWEGRLVATTRDVLREEEGMLAFAREGRGRYKPLAAGHTITDDRLNDEQRAAVRHVLTSRDRVMVVRGAAGVGKTTLSREAVGAIETGGKPVLTLAPSADASRGTLRTEGFEAADTVAKFLADADYRGRVRGGVVWVDEAGLLGTPTLARLFAAAHDVDARVVLMGDTKQHAAVERGAALRVLETHAGVPVASVRHVVRQRGEYRAAVEQLAEGKAAEGLVALDRLGWVRELPDGDRERAVAEAYVAAKAAGESVLVVSPTHAEAADVTAAIRAELKRQGTVRDERAVLQLRPANLTEAQRADAVNYAAGDVLQFVRNAPGHKAGSRVLVGSDTAGLPLDRAKKFQAYHAGELALGVEDVVRVTQNGWTTDRGHRLNNGSTYTVAGFTPGGDIRFDNGWTVAKDFGHLAHGYVGTSHGSQGRTVDRVLVAQSSRSLPAASREQFYVSVSRGRRGVTVFTDDKATLQSAVTQTVPRVAAVELLAGPVAGRAELSPAQRGLRVFRPVATRLGEWVAHRQRLAVIDRTRRGPEDGPRDHARGYER